MFKNYIKVAFRNLFRHKLFSFINITGLSIGLACCMLIILYTKDETSFDRFHENSDRIYRVTAELGSSLTGEEEVMKIGSTNIIVGPSLTNELPEVETYVRMSSGRYVTRADNETFADGVLSADENFFSVFSFPLLAGNPETALSDIRSVVLSENVARKYFGTTDVLGRTVEIQVDGSLELLTVTGVARTPPQNSSIQFDLLVPFGFDRPQMDDSSWMGFYINTYIVLHPEADQSVVEPKLDQVFASQSGETAGQVHFGLQPFLDIHLDTEYGDIRNGLVAGSSPVYSYILSGIAVLILIIACINFVNLTLVQSLRRGKEIGVRKVIGGERRQVLSQFLGESFLLCVFAFLIAILLVEAALPFFNELAGKQLDVAYLLDRNLIIVYTILFLVTGFAAGFYPAVVLSGFSPLQTIYSRFRLTGKKTLTKGLVTFQFALATFLMIVTMGIYFQFNYLVEKDLGYNDENLLITELGRGRHDAEISAIKNELANQPGIEGVTSRTAGQSYTLAGINGGEGQVSFAISWVDEDFLPLLEIPVTSGRNFSLDFPADATSSVIVNESFVTSAGWGADSGVDPVGQTLLYGENGEQQLTVIGVVEDYHFASLHESIGPLLLRKGAGDLWVKLNPEQLTGAIDAVQGAFERVVPLRPFSYNFLESINERYNEAESRWKKIVTAGSALSIFMSCLGLFGLILLSMQQRAKEIGIRKVLGAGVVGIMTLVSKDYMKLVLFGFVIAAPVAWVVISRWLEDFAYKIEVGPGLFLLAGSLIFLIGLATVSSQVVSAALTNPVNSLRSE